MSNLYFRVHDELIKRKEKEKKTSLLSRVQADVEKIEKKSEKRPSEIRPYKPSLLERVQSAVMTQAAKVMPREEWVATVEKEKREGSRFLQGISERLSPGMDLPKPPEVSGMEMISYPLKQIYQRPAEMVRAPFVSAMKGEPVGEAISRMLRAGIQPGKAETVMGQIPFQEAEQGHWTRLIPRAIISAIEDFTVYTGSAMVKGGITGKATRVEKAQTKKLEELYKKVDKYVPKFEEAMKKAGHKFPKDMSLSDKSRLIVENAKYNPDIAKPVKHILMEQPDIIKMYSGVPVPKIGDMVPIGGKTGEIIKIAGANAIVKVAGKSVWKKLADIIPKEKVIQPTKQEPEFKKIVESAGGEWKGVQKGLPAEKGQPEIESIVLFDVPGTKGATAALPVSKVTPESVKAKILAKQKEFGVKPPVRQEPKFVKPIKEKEFVEGLMDDFKVPPSKKPPVKKPFEKRLPEGMQFKEPTVADLLTSQVKYAEVLGIKSLVDPAIKGKTKLELTGMKWSDKIEGWRTEIDKLGKTTVKQKWHSKLKNVPTPAVKRIRNLLNEHETAPDFLSPEETEIFNKFRHTNRLIIRGSNMVRKRLGMEPIKYRKAYVRHMRTKMAQEMLDGRYPMPETIKYWMKEHVAKKVYNPMELQRNLEDKLDELWSKDLIHLTKSMVHTGLKEIYLDEPLDFFKKALTEVEGEIPASTKKWAEDFMREVIEGQETEFDAKINRIITQSGLGGLLNKVLAPFGRTLSRKPVTNLFQKLGMLNIYSAMGPIRPKQLLRNKFQPIQNLAFLTLKNVLKSYFPMTKQMKKMINGHLFYKSYTGVEQTHIGALPKISRAWMSLWQWSARTNVKDTMKAVYHDRLELIEKKKFKKFGWGDPKRTYKEPHEFLYPSEKFKMDSQLGDIARSTQYQYTGPGMPKIFRYKTLVPFTRLTSWPMNHFFLFGRDAGYYAFKGATREGWGLPISRRMGAFRYLILGGSILTAMGYGRSFLAGTAPTGLPPQAQLMIGLYQYAINSWGKEDKWKKRNKGRAKYHIYKGLKMLVPGKLAWDDFNAVFTGKKPLKSLFIYGEPPILKLGESKKKTGEKLPD